MFTDDKYSIDREDTSDEESESDIFTEKEKSKQGREDELDIGCKTCKERRRNLHKFLYEEIEVYGSDSSDKNNERKIYECYIIIWILSLHKVIYSECCSQNCRSENPSIHELH